MHDWVSYKNGNYTVKLNLKNGTKIRENDLDFFEADFPESMDLKITNRCTNPLKDPITGKGCGNCKFCHEGSGPCGKHGDIMSTSFIDKLHPYTEISIGGGNVLEHPDFIPFLHKLKALKMIPSITVHQNHFMSNLELLRNLRDQELIYGLGISLVNAEQRGFVEALKEFPNAVVHVINGIVSIPELKALAENNIKILILGYKEVRRGKLLYEEEKEHNHIEALKKDLYNYLPEIIENGWFDVVSFDNLAIKQLSPQRLMSEEKWNEMYMGDDGIDGEQTSASMFVDMVERKFARNSCASLDQRFELLDNIEDMYKYLKGE